MLWGGKGGRQLRACFFCMVGKFFNFFWGGGGERKYWDLTIHESCSFPSGETEALTRGTPLGLGAWRVVSVASVEEGERGELRDGIHGVEDRTHRDGRIFVLFVEKM